MRRIFIPSTSLLTSIAIVLSGLAFNPANATALADGTYLCSTGEPTSQDTNIYTITTVGSAVTLSDGGTCTDDVVIPEGVTAIKAYYSFTYNSSITSITIPSSVASIGDSAFSSATALRSVSFADGSQLTSIEDSAFWGTFSLNSINIPIGVISIGEYAFNSATSLSRIYFLGSAPATVGDNAFTNIASSPKAYVNAGNTTSFTLDVDGKWNGLIVKAPIADGTYLCSTGAITTTETPTYTITDGVVSTGISCGGDVVISDGVRSIENHAFSGAGSITSVTFADDGILTDIGVHAFEWIGSLTSITIPASVTSIGAGAFFGDTSLTSMFFLGDDPSPGGDIFWASQPGGYASATKAYFRTGATGFLQDSSGKWNGVPISPFYILTFKGTDSESGSVPSPIFSGAGENVTIPDNTGGLTKAGYDFAGWTDGLGNPYPVGIPGPMPAFDGTLLAAWTPSNSNVLDGTYECGSGTYTIATVGSAVTVSDGGTCTGDVVIPEGVTEISGYAFSTAQITSVSLPASLNAIGTQPFYGTRFLTQFTVASSNAVLTSVDGVLFESVGNGALLSAYPANRGVSSYTTPTSVSIAGASKTVTSIKTYAFQGAQKLTTLNISEGVTTLHYGIAESATLLSTINLPDSYTVMSETAFADANALTSIAISDLVTSIGATYFYGIRNLSSITVDNNNAYYSSIAGVLFDKSQSKLITYPQGKTGSNYAVRDGVTHIGSGAFRNSQFTSVSIPEGVTHIESGAFLGSRVESISLPDSLIEIASQAFQSSELMTVTIPINVSTLGKYAFTQASKLTSITVDGLNENYSSSNGVLFDKFQSKLIAYPIGNPAASYTIPSGVQTIGEDSFMSAPNLTSVVIPTDISTIESDAFTCAYYLTSFIFLGDAPADAAATVSSSDCAVSEPKAYIKSGNATFTLLDGKWKGLTVSEFDHFVNFDSKGGSAVSLSPFVIDGNVSAPTAPTRTGYGFIGWSTTNSVSEGGTAVTFPYTPGVTSDVTLFANWFRDGNYSCSIGQWTEDSTDTYTIMGGVVSNGGACTGDVDIPEGVTTIGTYAFGNSTITSISLPATLTSIDDSAFAGTTSLVSLTIPEGAVNISEWAFAYSQLLETITLPASIKNIGNTAFQDSLSLKNINVDTDNTDFASVNGVLFNKALTQLEAYPAGKPATSYTVPASVEIIDDRSFISSGALKTVLFTPDSKLTSLAGSVFQTSGLTSINLPEGVTAIGNAFNSAQNLTSVTIPASVTDIGPYAFQGATRLSSFYFIGGPPAVDPLTFTNIGPSPKAYLKSENTSFTADGEGKWNGLTVTFFDHFANFDSNDGSEVSASPFASGGSISAPTAPTRTGYTFSGWSTTDPGTAVTFPYTPGVASDITLFANWFEDGNFLCSGARAKVEDTNVYNITGGVVSDGSACTGDVVIPEGVTHIGTSAFDSSPVTSISLPNSLIEIGQQAFLGTGLITITIPKNVSTMGLGVFQNALTLTAITVAEPNVNYTSSSDGVLFNEGSTNLVAYPLGKTATAYTIPSSVNIIGDRAFMSAPTLTSVIIPSGVNTVEDLAFFCASSLTSIYFLGTAPGTIGNASFGCLSAEAKAHVENANVSSFALVDGKWNELTVEIVDPPVIQPVVPPVTNPAPNIVSSTLPSAVSKTISIKLPTFYASPSKLTKSQKTYLENLVNKSGMKATFVVKASAGKLPGVTDKEVKALAKKRGQVVKAYLVKLGISKSQIKIRIKIINQGIVPKTKILTQYLTS